MKKRVVIPVNNSKALVDLARKVNEKHLADGDSSLLKSLNWAEATAIITQAEQAQAKAEACKREMLEAYQQRELSMKILLEILRDSRDILTGANSKQMKVLGQWGFDVRDVRSTPC